MREYTIYVGLPDEVSSQIRRRLRNAVVTSVDGATVTAATGICRGQTEEIMIVSIITDRNLDDMKKLARELAEIALQSTVLVTEKDVIVTYV